MLNVNRNGILFCEDSPSLNVCLMISIIIARSKYSKAILNKSHLTPLIDITIFFRYYC
jgi:hypothetical protein